MELQKLPVSLVMIVHNSGGRLKEVIKAHRDIVSEVIVIDQGSTDGTYEDAVEVADTVYTRRHKGAPDPDKNFAYSLGTQEWVLALDDDEMLQEESKAQLASILKSGGDVVWIKRKNFINGVDMFKLIGHDPKCKLFKKGALEFEDNPRTYPTKGSNAVAYYSSLWIDHKRNFDTILKHHELRLPLLDDSQRKTEEEFIGAIASELRKQGAL